MLGVTSVHFRSGEIVEHLPTGHLYRIRYYNALSGNVRADRVVVNASGEWFYLDNVRPRILRAKSLQLHSVLTKDAQ